MSDFQKGEIIDGHFQVEGLCSESGGMGRILFVKDVLGLTSDRLVLKYCTLRDGESLSRFRREIRLLQEFKGVPGVVQIEHSNIEFSPPYFVMKFYEGGHLMGLSDPASQDLQTQENLIIKMIDCISCLHSRNIFHRDIKPENFLWDDDGLVISDLGLGIEPSSITRITRTTTAWGTEGYLPPEFYNGGFKYMDASSDIYMLGKSIYAVLTRQPPSHLIPANLNPSVYSVIVQACEPDKTKRFQKLDEMKSAFMLAFDVALGRLEEKESPYAIFELINDAMNKGYSPNSNLVAEFIDKLEVSDESIAAEICLEIRSNFFNLLSVASVNDRRIQSFLRSYRAMVENEDYSFPFSEIVAKNCSELFYSPFLSNEIRADALEIAIICTYRTNRFNAMDQCTTMIASVEDKELADLVCSVMLRNQHYFICAMEVKNCKNQKIRNLVRRLKNMV